MSERQRLSAGTYLALGARNLWRNPKRTAVTLAALVVGVGALTFNSAIYDAWLISMKNNFILAKTGHLQVHAKGFEQSRRIQDHMEDPGEVTALLKDAPRVAAWTLRVRVSGLVSVAGGSTGAEIIGVDPARESRVSRLDEFVDRGRWLEAGERRGILLGETLAEHLKVAPGDKIVLMAQAPGGDIVSEVFRLRGVLHSGTPAVDQALALIPLASARDWLGMGEGVTDVVVRAADHDALAPLYARLAAGLDGGRFEVLRWMDIDPTISQWTEFADVYTYVVLLIVIGLVLVEVLNTMLMSMHERVREFGLMEALGTAKAQLFAMLLWETLILVAVGCVAGYGIGALITLHFGGAGIDLSRFSDAFMFIYMDPVVHPVLRPESGVRIVVVTLLAALVAGFYPAWRATRLNPVRAMREV